MFLNTFSIEMIGDAINHSGKYTASHIADDAFPASPNKTNNCQDDEINTIAVKNCEDGTQS